MDMTEPNHKMVMTEVNHKNCDYTARPMSISNGPLAATTVGEGNRSTVLVHGFLGSGRNLRAVALKWAQQAPDRRFLMPDLRGHGDSPPVGDNSSLDTLAADVIATARAHGFSGPLKWVGHSLGGRVGLAAARIAPDEIEEVDLLDISPAPIVGARSESRSVLDALLAAPEHAPDRRSMRAFFVERGLSTGLADWIVMNLREAPGGVSWRIDRAALNRMHPVVTDSDLWEVIETGEVPVRVLRGGRSPYVPDEDAQRLLQLGCEVETIAEAGHYVHVDALDQVVDWLDGVAT